MSFRTGLSTLIPYVPFTLGSSTVDYLESVTVGPTPHISLAKSAVSTFLYEASDKIRVIDSKVPYRSW